MNTPDDARVEIGQDVLTVFRKGRSDAVVAKILGTSTHDGRTRIHVDRLIHRGNESTLGVWSCSGAITTILSREATPT